MREVTERVEGLENGTLKLVGTDFQKIVNETSKLLEDKDEYQKMVKAINPYGDGNTAKKIVEVLKNVS
jgi:UDP-N-acetylglucosamine 2-epimerase (non-hydrolysing)